MKRVLLAIIFLQVMASSCSTVSGSHHLLPPAELFLNAQPKSPSQVQLFSEEVRPPTGCIRIANLFVFGDQFTTRETLEWALRAEGAKIGVDFVIEAESRAMYEDRTMSAGTRRVDPSSTQRHILSGIGCRTAKVRLGIDRAFDSDEDWTISYVYPNSLAEKIGLKAGDRLLSVNGIDLATDPYAYEREVHLKSHGDQVTVVYRTREGATKTANVVLENLQ